MLKFTDYDSWFFYRQTADSLQHMLRRTIAQATYVISSSVRQKRHKLYKITRTSFGKPEEKTNRVWLKITMTLKSSEGLEVVATYLCIFTFSMWDDKARHEEMRRWDATRRDKTTDDSIIIKTIIIFNKTTNGLINFNPK